MKRIITKDIFNKMIETAKPEEIEVSSDIDFGGQVIKSLNTLFNTEGYEGASKLLFDIFESFAEKEGVEVDQVYFKKYPSSETMRLACLRLENERELTWRIECEANSEASRLREERKEKIKKEQDVAESKIRKIHEVRELEIKLEKLKSEINS